MRESKFQSDLIDELETLYPDAIIMKGNRIQGLPDLIMLVGQKWVALECKKSKHEEHQPNQDYWVEVMHEMSYAAFIFPENHDEILSDVIKFIG